MKAATWKGDEPGAGMALGRSPKSTSSKASLAACSIHTEAPGSQCSAQSIEKVKLLSMLRNSSRSGTCLPLSTPPALFLRPVSCSHSTCRPLLPSCPSGIDYWPPLVLEGFPNQHPTRIRSCSWHRSPFNWIPRVFLPVPGFSQHRGRVCLVGGIHRIPHPA